MIKWQLRVRNQSRTSSLGRSIGNWNLVGSTWDTLVVGWTLNFKLSLCHCDAVIKRTDSNKEWSQTSCTQTTISHNANVFSLKRSFKAQHYLKYHGLFLSVVRALSLAFCGTRQFRIAHQEWLSKISQLLPNHSERSLHPFYDLPCFQP